MQPILSKMCTNLPSNLNASVTLDSSNSLFLRIQTQDHTGTHPYTPTNQAHPKPRHRHTLNPLHTAPMHTMPIHGMPMHTMPIHGMPRHTLPMRTLPMHSHTHAVPVHSNAHTVPLLSHAHTIQQHIRVHTLDTQITIHTPNKLLRLLLRCIPTLSIR